MALTEIDRDLVERCVTNAPGSWHDFVDRFYGLFVHVAQHTAHSRSVRLSAADVDDLCAEVFLAVLANDFRILKAFTGESSLATYLAVIARRIVVKELMQRRLAEAMGHVTVHQESVHRALADNRTSVDNPDVQRVDDRDEVSRMLKGLGDRDARIVREYHIEGRSYSEISALMGVPENSIGPTLTRVRSQLRSRKLARP